MTGDTPRGEVVAILLAGGSGSRFGAASSKVYVALAGQPVLAHSLVILSQVDVVDHVIVVIRQQDRGALDEVLASVPANKVRAVVTGGATRQASEWAGISAAVEHCGHAQWALLHDAARPLVTAALITDVIHVARSTGGGALPGVQIGDDLVDDCGRLVPVEDLVAVQTPQAFPLEALRAVYPRALAQGYEGVDTSDTMQAFSDLHLSVVTSSADNLKITHPGDILRAERIIQARGSSPRP
ncbi:MAG: IspD/TarI family cytidylyltransferase [Euzebya sp.]